jgi:hypothetical protein
MTKLNTLKAQAVPMALAALPVLVVLATVAGWKVP